MATREEIGSSQRASVHYNRGVTSANPTFAHGAVVLAVSGINRTAFDDFTSQLRDGEAVSPGVVFFPMHRVERMEVDQANGDIPSIRQKFLAKCGCPAEVVLMPGDHAGVPKAGTPGTPGVEGER